MSFLELMRAGGAVMWILLAMSVVAVAVMLERIYFFLKSSVNAEKLELDFGRAIAVSEDSESAARAVVMAGDSSMHRLFRAVYAHWMVDREDVKLLVEQQVRRELYRWEKNLFLLGVIARTAPLLGLLGTVLGMAEMFGSMHLGGGVSSSAVTEGIWRALFTTIAGLSVAIPVLLVHGVLLARIDREQETLNRGADFLIREHFSCRLLKDRDAS